MTAFPSVDRLVATRFGLFPQEEPKAAEKRPADGRGRGNFPCAAIDLFHSHLCMTLQSSARQRSDAFLKISDQFKLGALVTESSHPVTANLSDVADQDIAEALDLLFQVDADVLAAYGRFAESGRALEIADVVVRALRDGGRMFFTGCGATGRLSIQLVSIWRDFWRQQQQKDPRASALASQMEHRASSVMAGGDFALIKSVEGFEDYAAFGRKQLIDSGVTNNAVVFAITEGGETSFVIGTARQGVDAGAKVYFVYNNPDGILCERVKRSREVICDPRIEKVNLTTGPMAITGSTRMQATTIQLCVMLTILEIVVRDLVSHLRGRADANAVPAEFLRALTVQHETMRSIHVRSQLAKWVELEQSVYLGGGRNNYHADRFGMDVLTDTTERSPTFCTPSFKKFDDAGASPSWSFLYLPERFTPDAWKRLLKRDPACIEWTDDEVRPLVEASDAPRVANIVRRIGRAELMRFRIGLDGLADRPLSSGDSAIAIGCESEFVNGASCEFFRERLAGAKSTGARTALVCFSAEGGSNLFHLRALFAQVDCIVSVRVPRTDLLLDGVRHVAV